MAERVLLVNGLPGSGKTTLATSLAEALHLPLISKDALKEALAAATPGVPPAALGRTAAETMWTLAAAVGSSVVLESWWFRPRDLGYARDGVRRSGASEVIEIWCDLPARVARERFERRVRPAFYQDRQRLQDSWPAWAAGAEPLALGPVVRVATDGPVDLAGLVGRVGWDPGCREWQPG